jgi:hypothetical protein
MMFYSSDFKTDKRSAKAGWAPGDYACKCCVCSIQFNGDKRASMCADCAYKTEPKINKFKEFTDDELYVLKRAFVESSFEFFMGDKYVEGERQHHKDMHNAVVDEIKRRKNVN